MEELEGKEIFQIPNGMLGKVNGPSHENGGVKLDLPDGTKIFSARLKVDGKTMAKRKEDRERRIESIAKKLLESPFDIASRNSLERTLETTAMEELGDLMKQGEKQDKEGEYKWGGKVKKYANGTGPLGLPASTSLLLDALLQSRGTVDPLPPTGISPVNPRAIAPVQSLDSTIAPLQVPTRELPISPDISGIDLSSIPFDDQVGPAGGGGGIGSALGSVASTAAGLASSGPVGAAIGTLGPLVTTIVNRLGDQDNENFFEGYGAQGLATNSLSMGGVDAGRQGALGDIDRTRVGTEGLLRSNSTSSNTLASNLQQLAATTQDSQSQVNRDATISLNQLLGQRATLQNQRDQQVMSGRERAVTRDIQDRDQFFTNLSSNLSNLGEGIMHVARNKRSPMTLADLLRF